MSKVFLRISWERGVLVRQRVPIPDENLPENFKVRPFKAEIVQRLHSDDFPLDQMRDMAEFDDWINQNLAPNLGDGIFYIQVYGRNWQRWFGKRRMARTRKGTHGLKVRKYFGLIALDKFEIKDGRVIRHFDKRGYRKIAPRNKKPTYPIYNLFRVSK